MTIRAAVPVLLSLGFLVAGCGGPREEEPAEVRVYEPFEARMAPPPFEGNPFDPDDIAVDFVAIHEEGEISVVPAFWNLDYEYSVGEDGAGRRAESLSPKGSPGFMARFAPRREGRYAWHWRIRTPEGIETSAGGDFLALPPVGRGPVVRGDSPRFLETHCGETMFFVGHNVAWSVADAPLADMLEYMDTLAASGQNCTRVWQCTWGFGIEHEQPGRYDLRRAWALDAIVERAREHGIYIIFCFENAHDIKERKSPYWRNGLIGDTREFFTSPEARRAFRNRVRYMAARWGYSTSILAWELFNEMDYTLEEHYELDDTVRERYFRPWLQEMSEALKKHDAHGRLITNSIAADRFWDEMNEYPWMGLLQHHTYMGEWDTDAAAEVLQASDYLKRYGKPFMLGEFGGLPGGVYGQTENVVNKSDPEGVHVHNSIWAGAFSGACGGPLNWWWDTYIRPNGLYHHYDALSRFLAGTPWGDPDLEFKDLTDDQARMLAMRGDGWARVWAQNRQYTWSWQGEGEPPPTEAREIVLSGLAPGAYRIEWWDTMKGEPIRTEAAQSDGTVALTIPSIRTTIAAQVEKTP